ncbi:hypothetical protein N7532_001641 [Penicillium argentinense]|uniref:Uncharacterized protein n=1 Tax=Penicillium argentinense TaxID=1131581 RepID=A0A9W9KMM4_9EURO|nr:uncharacterized protein N7532_001641 [Penicillium argentinense]KAJ5111106.1 hypothetical protein N7532_001641 [Penicillium argentinense]
MDELSKDLLPALSPELGAYNPIPHIDRYQLATGLKGQKPKKEPQWLSATENHARCAAELASQFTFGSQARQIYLIIIREEEIDKDVVIKPESEPEPLREASLVSNWSNPETPGLSFQSRTASQEEILAERLRIASEKIVQLEKAHQQETSKEIPQEDITQRREASGARQRGRPRRRGGVRKDRARCTPVAALSALSGATSPRRTRSMAPRGGTTESG